MHHTTSRHGFAAIAVAITIAMASTGCATLFASKAKTISIESDPPQADIVVDGAPVGQTPARIPLSNSRPHVISIQKTGYHAAGCQLLTSTGGGWVVLDVVTGIVPAIVDAVTASWNTLDRTECRVRLAQDGAAPGERSGEIAPPAKEALQAADPECDQLRALAAEEKKPRARYDLIRKMPVRCHQR